MKKQYWAVPFTTTCCCLGLGAFILSAMSIILINMTYNKLQSSFGTKNAVFSAWLKEDETGEWENEDAFKDDIPDRIVEKGNVILEYEGCVKNVKNPTWKTIMKFFEEAIKESGDYHHVFLEGYRKEKNILHLYSGS